MMTLITLADWKALSPRQQGYILYMQEEHLGSELKGQNNPYAQGTKEHDQFVAGSQAAVNAVMDMEE